MLSFECDYNTGAHPKVMEKLMETNLEAMAGYGADPYCASAADKIKAACECPEGEVCFLVGGTQTNQFVISTMLQPYEGVVAAKTGHVSQHEAGAIEYTGHKVLEIPGYEGKIHGDDLKNYIAGFYADENHEHMVFPGMVYISYPTEYGTIYSKAEMEEIYSICKSFSVPLFVDGARLGYGLMSNSSDMTLADMAKLCDVFYIGGTKVGALCGEAIVYTHNNAPKHLDGQKKQHGALLAKGRLLGIQFDTLFTDNLYLQISKHAIDMAEKLKQMFLDKGYPFFLESPTNQQFVILEDAHLKELSEKVRFSFWEKYDENHTVVRFATSWSTTDEDLKALDEII